MPFSNGQGHSHAEFQVDRAQLPGLLIAVIGHLNILPN